MTLAELIESRRRALGLELGKRLSYAELSARAHERGHSVSTPSFHSLATTPLENPPRRATAQAIAAALDVDESTVWLAVLESMGVQLSGDVAESERVQGWLALTGNRSDEEVQHLLRVVRTVAEGPTGAGHPDG